MEKTQKKFIQYLLKKKIIKFGKFILKSGRVSPYFFNMGLFNQGMDLYVLGSFYAKILVQKKLDFDVLFGPSYKGIPIVVSTAISLAEMYNINVNYCFNRKEKKNYGERDILVGYNKLKGKIIVVDDVITTGSTIEEIVNIIHLHKDAKLSGIVVALDRQETISNYTSSTKNIEEKYKCKVISIINFSHLVQYLQEIKYLKDELLNIEKYRNKYGIDKKQ